jgi:hypothetical protein
VKRSFNMAEELLEIAGTLGPKGRFEDALAQLRSRHRGPINKPSCSNAFYVARRKLFGVRSERNNGHSVARLKGVVALGARGGAISAVDVPPPSPSLSTPAIAIGRLREILASCKQLVELCGGTDAAKALIDVIDSL